MTLVEAVLLVLGLGVGFLTYRVGGQFMDSLVGDQLTDIGPVLLSLLAVLGIPVSSPAPFAGMAFPSWRYKTICGVIILFALVTHAYSDLDFFDSLHFGFSALLGWVIRFAVGLSFALVGIRLWRAWQDAGGAKFASHPYRQGRARRDGAAYPCGAARSFPCLDSRHICLDLSFDVRDDRAQRAPVFRPFVLGTRTGGVGRCRRAAPPGRRLGLHQSPSRWRCRRRSLNSRATH